MIGRNEQTDGNRQLARMKKLDAEALQKLILKLQQPRMLSGPNADRLVRVFYDATKIVYQRQKRLKKPELKMKEVASALLIAERVNSDQFHFEATGTLAECFGSMDEGAALDYYQNKVMGEVTDKFGRRIAINEDGMLSLYKDRETGRHVAKSENYEEVRGKRLPWIRHTLMNSESVFISEEKIEGSFRRSFVYTAVVSVPMTTDPQYYVVWVRQSKSGADFTYKFVTAYTMFKRNRFLEIIEECRIWEGNSARLL
ncbi:hypothetical protein SBA5_450113 [Candidatus Sulfotelmatomonas gaucii]|uniref:Uncharacterized protein n=1 Tax=Candidatus Sulfuritelmatomonas gaucii TaxID=2043161 RepID=A0A2N9LN65_9BACT|nr:hypothetical protein SBA5_450113 [Candidatus Sulfotelmatomonas gaucii]